MTITTMAQLQAALPGRRYVIGKSLAHLSVAGASAIASSWTATGGAPATGATPPTGAGEVPTASTTGAIPLVAPGGGNSLYLAELLAAGGNVNAGLALYDRLVHTSGLSGTVTTAQTVNSAAVNRPDATATNTELWLEIYTGVGTTAQTATVSYTNQAGTAGQTGTCTIGASGNNGAGLMIAVQLASGDTGVRSVQTVTLAGSTLTAGNFGITITRTLAWVPMGIAVAVGQDHFNLGLAPIPSSACLFFGTGGWPAAGNLGDLAAELLIVEG